MGQTTKLEQVEVASLRPYERNAKLHPRDQIEKLKRSIEEFGFLSPCLIDKDGNIIAGHGRVQAAKELGLQTVPCVYVEGLTEEQRRAYIIADNRLTELGGWDEDILKWELGQLESSGFDVDLIGFQPTQKKEDRDPARAYETLAQRFLVPPFSVLDSRQKWWQDRKRAWRDIGIESGSGRGNDANGTTDGLTYANSHVPPGLYKSKNKIEEALGTAITWDEFFQVLPSSATLSNTSLFDPVLCEIAYRWYTNPGDRILDPFAGGSVRGITASLLGRRYTGIDLSERQITANNSNWDAAEAWNRITDGRPAEKPLWVQGDSARLDDIISGDNYDFLFTCPPYADLEVYSDKPEDLSNMSYPEFCKVYSRVIKSAVAKLKRNAFAVVVVGDIRDSKGFYRDFISYTINSFVSAGMRLYNEGILITSTGAVATIAGRQFGASRKAAKNHQNVLVFSDARGSVRALSLEDEGKQEQEIIETLVDNGGRFSESHVKVLTFANGDPKKRTAELGQVDMETIDSFDVKL